MSENASPIWLRSDEHSRKLTQIEIDVAVHKSKIDTHDTQIAQIAKDSSERHGQLVALLAAGSEKMDTIIADYNQQLGASRSMRFALPVLISIIAILAGLGYFVR